MRQLNVAILSQFQTIGLEEWITGSDTFMTTVRCKQASSIVSDPVLIQNYADFFGLGDEGL